MPDTERECLIDLRILVAEKRCSIIESAFPELHGTMTADELFSAIQTGNLAHYVDREQLIEGLDLQTLVEEVAKHGEALQYFRMNTAHGIEWVTAKITPYSPDSEDLRVTITSQGNCDVNGTTLNEATIREILFDGLGTAYKNLIFIDVLNDRYKMLNTYNDEIAQKLEVPARDGYSLDNQAYATNLVFENDQQMFLEHTSLSRYRSHLNRVGARDTFMIRHRSHEEFRWVSVNTVCTRRDENAFHVLYWIAEPQDSPYGEDTQTTLFSELIGQFRWERRTGHTPRLIVGDTYKNITGIGNEPTPEETYQEYFSRIVPEDWEKYHAYFLSLREGVQSNEELTYRWMHPTKGLRYFRGRAICLAATDDYTCYRGYHQDITDIMQERIEKDAELARALEAAERARYAKDDFFSKLSHDIRTPLNAVLGYAELLEKCADDSDARANYVAKIKDSSTVLYSLINNVLEMAHLDASDITVELRNVNIGTALTSVESILSSKMADKGLYFTQDVRLQHPDVRCDIAKLNEVFLNILNNAIEYTPAGGHISLTLTEEPGQREGWGLYTTKIADDGIGMSAGFLPHLFETFTRERTDAAHATNGTGLGGAIIKQLMELMGGTVSAESEPGRGTTITIALELQFAESDKKGSAADSETPFAGKRVLLAEDNDLNAEIATEILVEMGLEVERAENGKKCFDMMLRADSGYYDLVFMDLMMPEMDGLEATRAIRQLDFKRAHVPIVAMTANALDTDRMKAFDAGMDDFVAKPIMIDQLEEVLHKYLG